MLFVSEDHARGLSTFTIMAGLGGFFGYALGGINWDETFIGWFKVLFYYTSVWLGLLCFSVSNLITRGQAVKAYYMLFKKGL